MDKINLDIVCFDQKYIPTYGNTTDACMDLKLRLERKNYILTPGETKMFGTGIKAKIPEGYYMFICPRSSIAKINCMLANTVGIIDSGYRDEIKIVLHNYGKYSQELEDGQRVAQFMIKEAPRTIINVVPDDIKFKEGDRHGGFGSTGK